MLLKKITYKYNLNYNFINEYYILDNTWTLDIKSIKYPTCKSVNKFPSFSTDTYSETELVMEWLEIGRAHV